MTIRVDLLRAKSVQAEVSYLHDIKKFSELKQQEQHLGVAAQKKEKQFWSETVKTLPANNIHKPQAGPQSAILLERMRHAHGELRDAQIRYRTSCQQTREVATQMTNSSKRLEIMQQLLAKAQRRVSQQQEARVAEEVTDVAQLLKNPSLAARSVSARAVAEGSAAVDPDSVALVSGVESPEANQPLPILAPPLVNTRDLSQSLDVGSVKAPVIPAALEVQTIECRTHQNGTELSIRCAIGSERSVSLSIIKREGEGLKVTLNPSCSVSAGVVVREKGLIQARLQAMGFKISSLEVETGGSQGSRAFRSRRSRTGGLEDDDETLVA